MSSIIFRNSNMMGRTGRLLLTSFLLLVAPLGGCPDEGKCESNADCPMGQYCGSNEVCTFDCRTDRDCPGGSCSSLGKCVGDSKLDGGADGSGADAVTSSEGGAEAAGADGPTVDRSQQDAPPSDKPGVGELSSLDVGPSDGDGQGGDGAVPGTWKLLSKGTFGMGSPDTELCRNKADEDSHQVTLSHDFYITTTEVTQANFLQVSKYSPSAVSTCGSSCPVETVNWHEAAAYCNNLSALAGLAACYTCQGAGVNVICDISSSYTGSSFYTCPGYRLPTEAEWEYAARASSVTPLYNGSLSTCSGSDTNAHLIAWYIQNSGSKPHPGGQKMANLWYLYDMSGNILEWVNDWYQASLGTSATTDPVGPTSGTKRVLRGGSWTSTAGELRTAARFQGFPTGRANYAGFRCVRTSTP